MYAFLAIVEDRHLHTGEITPDYILCKTNVHTTSRNANGWRVVSGKSKYNKQPRVLVTTLAGHDDMIDFLSSYRTRKRVGRNKKSYKFRPHGAIFWFECNVRGEPIGSALFVKRVPVKGLTADQGWQRLLESQRRKMSIAELLSRDILFEKLDRTDVVLNIAALTGINPSPYREPTPRDNEGKFIRRTE